jgi:Flp pilus assembly CpaE family ATPase
MSNDQVTVVCSPNDDIVRSLLAIHLAAPSGLLVDVGLPCGGLDVLLDVVPEKSWADLLPVADELTADLVARATTPCPGTGGLLAAPGTVCSPTPGLIGALIARARERHERVVVDVSPSGADLWAATLRAADRIALVVRGDLPGVVAGQRCLRWLREAGWQDRVRVVVAAMPTATAVSPAELTAALGPLFAQLPWDPQAVAHARNLGEPGQLPRSALRTALAETAARWQGEAGGGAADGAGRSRWQQTGQLLKGLMGRRLAEQTT